MTKATTQITCPNCGHSFNAEEALEKQLLARFEREYQERAAQQTQIFNREKAALDEEREQLRRQRDEQEQLIRQRLEFEKKQLLETAQARAREDLEQQLQALKEENRARREENLQLKRTELELLRRESELKEAQERLQIETERQLLEKQTEIEARVRATEHEKSELRFREYEKRLDDQKKLIAEMKRKAEQGSMQMQGEVQELALEELLEREFPFDRIEQVPKGVRGADVVQTVFDSFQNACGKIILESKRTKVFSNEWIGKLKEDQVERGADLAVIVTEAMPAEMQRFGERDGVWICSFCEIKGLIYVLREMLLRTQALRTAQENKGDKMELLYQYLTSMEFKQRVEAIVDGFSGLKSELDRERNAMQRIWKSREKQIEKIINNTIDMYGSVRGIAGSSIATIPALELPHLDAEEQ